MRPEVFELRCDTESIQGAVELTGSKSESNRALVLNFLSKGAVKVENLSTAVDTEMMLNSLQTVRESQSGSIDVGLAGTTMRFLTGLLSLMPGRYELSGTERMHQRPIGLLVDALRSMGADISYLGEQGFPPLSISGGWTQHQNHVTIPGDISSQFLSALLLIAPALPLGLSLEITGELTSRPYLTMTLEMLAESGVKHTWTGNTINIAPQPFQETTLYIEPDWSAASYWYSVLALAPSGNLFLPGLKQNSLQGDRAIADLMRGFGIETQFEQQGVRLSKISAEPLGPIIDCTAFPDLAQTLFVCAAAQRKDLSFTGLHTLRIKETDRIAALTKELAKCGVKVTQDGEVYRLQTKDFHLPEKTAFDTYEDHRMAMAFAPLALIAPIQINDPQVVEKSYPRFWEDLETLGIIVK